MSNNFHLQLYRGTTAQNDAYTGLSGEVTVDTTLSKLRLHDGSTAGGVEIGGMPVGSIIPYAGTTIPAGYLLCDGSAISRTTYSALFASIGTTYGEGDGNSTFNIPDFNNGLIMAGDMFCKGNGLSLGLTDGTNNFGITGSLGEGYVGSSLSAYGSNIGGSISSSLSPNRLITGITTDPTKSGIIVDIDSLIILCSAIIKY